MSGENQTTEKVKKLECPFTWDMDDISKIKKNRESKTFYYDATLVPILKLMRLIVSVYENFIKEDFTESQECLKLAETTLKEMKNNE